MGRDRDFKFGRQVDGTSSSPRMTKHQVIRWLEPLKFLWARHISL